MNAIGLRYNPEPATDWKADKAQDYALDLEGDEEAAAMRAYFAAYKREAQAFRDWVAQCEYERLNGGTRPW